VRLYVVAVPVPVPAIYSILANLLYPSLLPVCLSVCLSHLLPLNNDISRLSHSPPTTTSVSLALTTLVSTRHAV
jgi:hypothetical protein